MEDSIKFTWMNHPHCLALSAIKELENSKNINKINSFSHLCFPDGAGGETHTTRRATYVFRLEVDGK